MRLRPQYRVVLPLLVVVACQPSPSAPGSQAPKVIAALPRTLTAGEQGLIAAGNSLGPALLARVNATRGADNVFISPLSASMALGMTLNGAAGTTYDEMRATLGFGSMPRAEIITAFRDLIALLRGLDGKVDFRIANSIWYRDSFAPAVAPVFLTEAREYFDATSAGLDFTRPEAVTTINDWVKAGTNGKIDSIIDRISPEIVMLLVNAIYFKGDWRTAFDKSRTANAPFSTESGTQLSVPTMNRTGTMRVGTSDGRTIVDLGYGGDAFSMTIVLPRAGESVNTLVANLTPALWSSAVSSLAEGEVELSMPRFAMRWEAMLNDALKAMGMPTAFVAGGADFSRLSPTRGRELYISFVKQKTYVDVNEEGTEAAAVTGVGVGVTSVPQRTVVKVNRPFIFAIRERLSGTILFLGKIVAPTSS